jgi:uncharacterized protein (TIGR01777 family)
VPQNQTHSILQKDQSVLITGGGGLIGKYLTSSLLSSGYKVSHLSRKSDQFGKVRVFRWDPEKSILNLDVLEGIDYIVHLAGANIGEMRWTKNRKKEIVSSRIESARLIYKTITDNRIKLKAFISASAIGYYGSATSDIIFTEEFPPGEDFLGNTCKMWEQAADQFCNSGTRVVKIRTGVVMEKSDSALSKFLIPARKGVFPRLGNGQQYIPWIHITDLCGIYLQAIRDENTVGAFNAVSPQHVTQTEFIRTLAQVLNKSFIHPPVPAIILRAALGEMSTVVLKGSRVSSEKILKTGYNFLFPDLSIALKNIVLS